MKVCLVICWLGDLPSYLSVWAKSCAYNPDFDFLLFTDELISISLPENVKNIVISKELVIKRVKDRIVSNPKISKPYRLCDFRAMYGIIFEEELKTYDFWGYCDIDVVFGKLDLFITKQDLKINDAIFNAGHFTLIRNTKEMNNLFKEKGALFNYKKVASVEAVYAFDETTGIQRIAHENNVRSRFGIPYIEAEAKYTQLRSRMEKSNPDQQAFYWECGHLYRIKSEKNDLYYQEIAYIHLQKRKIELLDLDVANHESFWITPRGFKIKKVLGRPSKEEILVYNPDDGIVARKKEEREYKRKKIASILRRNPFQIYVRLRQQFAGINDNDGKREEMEWIKY